LLPALGEESPPASDAALTSLGKLQTLLDKNSTDRERVAEQARQVNGVLSSWLPAVGRPRSDQALVELLNRFTRYKRHVAGEDWDGATQLYLALAASYRAASDRGVRVGDPAGLKAALEKLRGELESSFPNRPGVRFDSPSDFRPGAIEQPLKRIQEQLGSK
jgi:hypothetical protein